MSPLVSHGFFICSPALRFISSPGNASVSAVNMVEVRGNSGPQGPLLSRWHLGPHSREPWRWVCVCMLLCSHWALTSAQHWPRVPPQQFPLSRRLPGSPQPTPAWLRPFGHRNGVRGCLSSSGGPACRDAEASSRWPNPIAISMYIGDHPSQLRATTRFWKSTQVSWIHFLHQGF